MDFYNIKDSYIDFLRQYDTRVADNKHEGRPYIGIIIAIDDISYYAPLTSPKPKHLKMKNGKDFRKIKQGLYGGINFNNMIPVPDSALLPIKISQVADDRYRRLLQNQYAAVKDDFTAIVTTATRLRKLLLTAEEHLSPHDARLKARCCDIRLLEKVFREYAAG